MLQGGTPVCPALTWQPGHTMARREGAVGVDGVHVCHHQGMVDNWRQYLKDGVHYNAAGIKSMSNPCVLLY